MFIRMGEVRKIVPLSKPTIYRRIRAGDFPAPVRDGRCSMWVESEVRAYAARLSERRPGGAGSSPGD
jgi:prophage regulatory protein